MDETRFDDMTRALGGGRTRRSVARLVAGSILGGLIILGGGDAAAKRRGKKKQKKRKKGKKPQPQVMVAICHEGQTIEVTEAELPDHLDHGDIEGSCGCIDRGTNEACQDVGVTSGVCCDDVCTQLNTKDNCSACGDVCEDAGDVCSGLGSGGDPDSGCCIATLMPCDPLPLDRCCNASTCTGTNLSGENICCGISGTTSCSFPGQCCSGVCGSDGLCG